ncbi:molybdenum cofactor guanylyltransferase [Aestuariivirga sp.]|uniref:molybdenum cofactor guanylyltransferase n=1 Tax=Aestuariivirga sp. TaxID=2650926 RepID=UPI00391DC704
MRVSAVIVAGGRSSRMGREKVLERVGGRTILERIVSLLREQADIVVINANGNEERFAETGLPVIRDIRPDVGTPLAGLHTALSFAASEGFDAVLTVPSDSPFLPTDLVSRLAGEGRSAAIAASSGQAHYLTGLWSPALLQLAEQVMAEPRPPRVQDWAKRCQAAIVEWSAVPYDPLLNVNTPEELAEANRIAAEFSL